MFLGSGGLGEILLVILSVGVLWLQDFVLSVDSAGSGWFPAVSPDASDASPRTVLCRPVYSRRLISVGVGLQKFGIWLKEFVIVFRFFCLGFLGPGVSLGDWREAVSRMAAPRGLAIDRL